MNATYVEEFRTRIFKIFVDIRKLIYRASLIRNKYVKEGMDSKAAGEARDKAFPEAKKFIFEEISRIKEYLDESSALAKSIKARRVSSLLSSIDSLLNTVITIVNRGEYPGPEFDTLRSFVVAPKSSLLERIESYVDELY